jgi:hypothetical protein
LESEDQACYCAGDEGCAEVVEATGLLEDVAIRPLRGVGAQRRGSLEEETYPHDRHAAEWEIDEEAPPL